MNELLQIVVMAVTATLFALGGTEIKKYDRGFKAFRRYGIPLFLAFICVLSGVSWWQVAIYTVALFGALTAPYGSRTPYWVKVLVFCAYSGVSLCIGFSWWVVICPALLTLFFLLSNLKLTAKTLFWKVFELQAGFLVAASLIAAINNRYPL